MHRKVRILHRLIKLTRKPKSGQYKASNQGQRLNQGQMPQVRLIFLMFLFPPICAFQQTNFENAKLMNTQNNHNNASDNAGGVTK